MQTDQPNNSKYIINSGKNSLKFIPGLKLSELFFHKSIKPVLKSNFPDIQYSAGLIDYGSEVLGFDDEMSTDHNWGPRVQLFLRSEDIGKREKISEVLSQKLPSEFKGFSTNFMESEEEKGTLFPVKANIGEPIRHRVDICTRVSFFQDYLGINNVGEIAEIEWLTLSEQRLRTIRCGKVFHDSLGIEKDRAKLHYYPKDVWLFMLASEWSKIGQEEPFIGRCGMSGDEIGSQIITTRFPIVLRMDVI